MLATTSWDIFSNMILMVHKNFKPFICFISCVSLYWMAFLVSLFCFNGSFVVAISNDFVYPSNALFFFFYLRSWCCDWHDIFFCSGFWCWCPSISDLNRWWKNVFFICLNRLSHTLSFEAAVGLLTDCFPNFVILLALIII